MYYGFTGLCADFLEEHPEYFVIPVRITGSSIESIFSSLEYISGENLSAINYSSSLAALATQRETTGDSRGEDGYINQINVTNRRTAANLNK